MKLHKLELKSVDVGDKEALSYAALVKTVISAPGQGGMSCDDLLLSVAFQTDLAAAVAKGADHLLLSSEQSAFLKTKLDAFRWGATHPAIADFILHVRALPLTEVEAK